MDPRTVARGVAAGRVVFGLLMLFVPNLVLKRASPERPGPLVWMSRAFGIRDVVLGAGALVALADEDADEAAAAHWVTMGAAADSADAVAALLWKRELGWSGTLSTWSLAVPAAAAGWWSAAGLRRRQAAPPSVSAGAAAPTSPPA